MGIKSGTVCNCRETSEESLVFHIKLEYFVKGNAVVKSIVDVLNAIGPPIACIGKPVTFFMPNFTPSEGNA